MQEKPDGHVIEQLLSPPPEKYPAGHLVWMPLMQYVPGAQVEQLRSPALEKVPSLHGACASAKHANPAGQVIVQELDPGTENVPGGQAVQAEAPAAA